MALLETQVIDVLDNGKVIGTLDASTVADNRDAMQRIYGKWNGGVVARAIQGDVSLTREQVMEIPRWRQSLQFRHVFLDGSTRVHKISRDADRLAAVFGETAHRAYLHAIDASVADHRQRHAEQLRRNAAKYEQALSEIESQETAADRLRDKILSVKDPKRRAELREKYPELFRRKF